MHVAIFSIGQSFILWSASFVVYISVLVLFITIYMWKQTEFEFETPFHLKSKYILYIVPHNKLVLLCT